MMTRCPSFTQDHFDRLRSASEEQVERDFHQLILELHDFLNNESAVRDLQSHRARWASPRDPYAFRNFKTDPEHWYTFNHGGRSEGQLNIGMSPRYLRIGLGFEFTEKEHGRPKQVREAFVGMLNALGNDRSEFETLVDRMPVEMEIYPARGGGLGVIETSSVVSTLLDLPREPQWIFIGRLLRPEVSADTLESGELMAREIDRIFVELLPWWRAANTGGA